VFASAQTPKLGHRRHTWTGQPFTKLYVADVGEEMSLGSPAKFDKSINSKFNESTCFTKDGNHLFHKKQLSRGKKGKDGNDRTLVKIYKASLENDKWVNITELP
jgi:hypothetical protein